MKFSDVLGNQLKEHKVQTFFFTFFLLHCKDNIVTVNEMITKLIFCFFYSWLLNVLVVYEKIALPSFLDNVKKKLFHSLPKIF